MSEENKPLTDQEKEALLKKFREMTPEQWEITLAEANRALITSQLASSELETLTLYRKIDIDKPITTDQWNILQQAARILKKLEEQLRDREWQSIKEATMRRIIEASVGVGAFYIPNVTTSAGVIAGTTLGGFRNEAKNEINKELDGRVEIFFGTNRVINDSTNIKRFFGSKVGDLLTGTCMINIPKAHKQGRIERPASLFGWELSTANDQKHIRLKELKELESEAFYRYISDKLRSLDEQSALVFIHGYNNTFEQAARRAGQFAWDLPFDGVTALFSWPSAGRTTSYATDMDRADQSVPAFKQFLVDLIDHTGVQKVHLVAHSMGNRVMTGALKELANESEHVDKLNMIEQIVLAAPDLDQGVFRDTLLPMFKKLGNRRTLYASKKDKALLVSEIIRDGNPRLGDGGKDLFISEEIDSIDASNVKSKGAHHSYVFQVNEVLTDIFYLFKNSFAPDERRLMKYERDGQAYWEFKDW